MLERAGLAKFRFHDLRHTFATHALSSGVDAKMVILDGLVSVNGEVELRRGKKIYPGDVVTFEGESVKVVR